MPLTEEQQGHCEATNAEAVSWKCPLKKVLLKISQNSQEDTSARVSFLISCKLDVNGTFCVWGRPFNMYVKS